MIFLILTILLNAYLSIVFKLFELFRVDAFAAIVVNYWVCVATGSVMLGRFPIGSSSVEQPWFYWAIALGCGFISIFNLIAWSTKEDGITTTTIANKLSLVIPVAFALFFFAGERFHWTKIIGILTAFPAVYFATKGSGEERHGKRLAWLAPLLLFVGSGGLDTAVSYVTRQFFSGAASANQPAYLVHTFATAGTVGILILAGQLMTGSRRWAWRNLAAGIMLGVPNFFSIYFLLRTLSDGPLQPSAAIPVLNIGIVVAATLCAIFFFRERANRSRWIGLVLSVVAIFLISFADLFRG